MSMLKNKKIHVIPLKKCKKKESALVVRQVVQQSPEIVRQVVREMYDSRTVI
jgi:hypothetical protein